MVASFFYKKIQCVINYFPRKPAFLSPVITTLPFRLSAAIAGYLDILV